MWWKKDVLCRGFWNNFFVSEFLRNFRCSNIINNWSNCKKIAGRLKGISSFGNGRWARFGFQSKGIASNPHCPGPKSLPVFNPCKRTACWRYLSFVSSSIPIWHIIDCFNSFSKASQNFVLIWLKSSLTFKAAPKIIVERILKYVWKNSIQISVWGST
jgi:hypothetical protein